MLYLGRKVNPLASVIECACIQIYILALTGFFFLVSSLPVNIQSDHIAGHYLTPHAMYCKD